MRTNERNGWRTVGLLVIGAFLGISALIATAKFAKRVIEKQEQLDYNSEYSDEPETRRSRFKNWFFELLGLEMNEWDEWRPTFRTVGIAAFVPFIAVFLLSTALRYYIPIQTFDVTLSPVRVWVSNDQVATPKANVTIIASGTAVDQIDAQLDYLVTDLTSGKVVETGTFENRLYADIGFNRGQAGASYRIDVILIRQGHGPWTVSQTFTIPSKAALPGE